MHVIKFKDNFMEQRVTQDHPLYLVCPDVLSLVRERLSGGGGVWFVELHTVLVFFT
jgi:hypothetical protein